MSINRTKKSKAGFCIHPSAKSHRHEKVKEGSGRSDEGMSVVLISLGWTFRNLLPVLIK